MRHMSISRNTAYNIVGAISPIVLALITVPVYLRFIGEARYGVLAIAWLFLGYFGLFDLGLGRATAQRIAALGDMGTEDRAQTFWTAVLLNIGLGILGGLFLLPAATYFFNHVFKIDDALRPELITTMPWLVLAVPVMTLSGVLTGALQGREQFFELNVISVVGVAIFQIFPLLIAWLHGPTLIWLIPAAILARFTTLGLLSWRCHRHIFSGYGPRFVRSQARGLLHFGGWVTITSLIGPMMIIFDRFLIGAVTGSKDVTYYTVPFQFASRITLVPNALTTSLFPRMATASLDEACELTREALQALLVVITPLVVVGLIILRPFLVIWLGHTFAEKSALVGQILLLGFWVNSFAFVPYAQLQARGRPDLVAKCHIAEILPYFVLLFSGLKYYGLVGAAVAFSFRSAADLALLAWLGGIMPLVVRMFMVPSLLLAGGLLTAKLQSTNHVEWYILASILLIITLVWSWKVAPDSIQSVVLRRIRLLFLR